MLRPSLWLLRWYWGAFAVLSSGPFTACSPRFDTKDAGTKPPQASALVGPKGGTVTLTQGPARGASIYIPSGALGAPVTITMSTVSEVPELPAGASSAGPVVNFGPEGLVFLRPATVTLPTTRVANMLYTRPQHGGTWTKVEGASYDSARRVMVAGLKHFSLTLPVAKIVTSNGPAPDVFPATGYLLRNRAPVPDGLNAVFLCLPNCTVTLIRPNVVLTAAHCTYEYTKSVNYGPNGEQLPSSPGAPVPLMPPLAVGFGTVCDGKGIPTSNDPAMGTSNNNVDVPCNETDPYSSILQYRQRYKSVYRVVEIHRHPNYVPQADDTTMIEKTGTDLAYLVLNKAVDHAPMITPAALPDENFAFGTMCNAQIVGYGGNPNPAAATACVYSHINPMTQSVNLSLFDVYAGGNYPGSVCPGDSGGPLYNSNGVLFGIASNAATPCDLKSQMGYASLLDNFAFIQAAYRAGDSQPACQ